MTKQFKLKLLNKTLYNDKRGRNTLKHMERCEAIIDDYRNKIDHLKIIGDLHNFLELGATYNIELIVTKVK